MPGFNGHNGTHNDEAICAEDGSTVSPRMRGSPDATVAALVNSREDWPQRKTTAGLSSASLSRAAGSLWQRGPGLSEETQREVEVGLVATPVRLSRVPGFVTQLLTGR